MAEAEVATRGAGRGRQQRAAATILADVRKFYDNFDLDTLEARALELGMPGVLARLSVNVYRGLRIVKLGTAVLIAGYARCGLPAGCGLCFLWVVTYSLRPLEQFHRQWPMLGLSVYLGDLSISKEGKEEEVLEDLTLASIDLNAMVQARVTGLGASVAMDKLGVAASNPRLAKKLAQAIGVWAGAVEAGDEAPINLESTMSQEPREGPLQPSAGTRGCV